MVWREVYIRQQLRDKIVESVRGQLRESEHTYAAKIRAGIKKAFDGLKQRIVGSIEEEIALIDASLQGILDLKRQGELHADQERQRLEAARTRIEATQERLRAAV
jgi:hypothetical protein